MCLLLLQWLAKCLLYLAVVTYRVLVVGEGKHFGLSTACLYVLLAGEVGEAGVAEMPRGEYQTDISVCALHLSLVTEHLV